MLAIALVDAGKTTIISERECKAYRFKPRR
jgi:hypothetical protein